MTSVSPPTYYFDGITFNSAFYTKSSSGGLTEAEANALYLKKNTADTASALETFNGGILTNDIQSTTTSTDLIIGEDQTDGILKLGTGGATRTSLIQIGSGTQTGQINILTANTNNNVASSIAAINIGTTNVTKLIRIGSQTTNGTVTLGDLQVGLNTTTNGVFLNTIANTTRDINIGSTQTQGKIAIGCGGATPATRISGANVEIATQASNACDVNVMNGATTGGAVKIATGTGTLQSTAVQISSGSTTGTVTIGNGANTTELKSGTTTVTGTTNLSGTTTNIRTGTGSLGSVLGGTVNIATGTGVSYVTTAVNIATGNTTGTVAMGNPANQIELNAPTLVKSIRQDIIYFGGNTYTLTEANAKLANVFGSTYALANPSTANDSITVTLPAPTASMAGMTLVFRKMRGAIGTGSQNWLFSCATSVIVPTSLTAPTLPTVVNLSVTALTARFLVMEYSGSFYYFVM